ncbi:ribbon-helix-helix protein, CopG family [bacterium]|nr:MAG: ribbon-helix-helix protein, CopG family [bacterium]
MRQTMNISVSPKLKKAIEAAVQKGGYTSKSEFLRDIFRAWEEQQILKDVRQSEREFAAGKGKILKSLRDLR